MPALSRNNIVQRDRRYPILDIDTLTSEAFAISMVHILLIDDDPDYRDWVASILRSRGHEVVATSSLSSVEALSCQAKLRTAFDVAIVDMIMPEMDGIETIRALKALCPSTRIIAMSGGGQHGDAQLYLRIAEQFGAIAALTKPFMASDLGSAIARALRST